MAALWRFPSLPSSRRKPGPRVGKAPFSRRGPGFSRRGPGFRRDDELAFALPRFPDRVPQCLVADGALEDLIADDEGRGSARLEVAGELEVSGELAVCLRGGKVAVQADCGPGPGDGL